ncbi:hypothetical protein DFP72DRAFT_862346 [Ephemerocybe angulata]|uniref:Uncharacterized protein n=1 Tax=Ephemerocybe angulata TaxID=980116 RepID=A0A8H6H6L8_9AGAR|nr:hypothetical protein DFP72DRAFT_862346 [Tulosesus angulatus]
MATHPAAHTPRIRLRIQCAKAVVDSALAVQYECRDGYLLRRTNTQLDYTLPSIAEHHEEGRIALPMPTSTGQTRVRSPDPPEPRTGLERLGDTNSSLAKPREDRARRRTSDRLYHLLPMSTSANPPEPRTGDTNSPLARPREDRTRRRTGDQLYPPPHSNVADPPESRNGLERLGDANSSLARPREDRTPFAVIEPLSGWTVDGELEVEFAGAEEGNGAMEGTMGGGRSSEWMWEKRDEGGGGKSESRNRQPATQKKKRTITGDLISGAAPASFTRFVPFKRRLDPSANQPIALTSSNTALIEVRRLFVAEVLKKVHSTTTAVECGDRQGTSLGSKVLDEVHSMTTAVEYEGRGRVLVWSTALVGVRRRRLTRVLHWTRSSRPAIE